MERLKAEVAQRTGDVMTERMWKDRWRDRCDVAEAEVERSHDAILALTGDVERLRAFAKRLLIVHEMRDEKTAEAILESALRGEGEK